MLFYAFVVICFDWYKEQTICLISFNKRSEFLPAFTYARAIGSLWNICFGINILSLEWSVLKRPEPLDFIKNTLPFKPSKSVSLASQNLYKF